VINSASNVVFFVTGRDKAAIMRQLLDKKGDAMLPAARVRPLNGRLLYVLDEGAASRLDRDSLRDHVSIVVHP
ncbi:MAG TPA: 6-phosphogluconolactonase, partial [Deltaproteobacteria bacterium]|nr:6-phosphogluconolactonase [Deltaproteobacteria bacterium]